MDVSVSFLLTNMQTAGEIAYLSGHKTGLPAFRTGHSHPHPRHLQVHRFSLITQ